MTFVSAVLISDEQESHRQSKETAHAINRAPWLVEGFAGLARHMYRWS